MAPTAKLIARDATTDPGFMLLYYALKNVEEGKPNFTKVAKSMGLDTANAASKRYARLIKVQDDAEGGGTGGNESPKPKATPRKGSGKKKIDGADASGDDIGDGSPSPKKKQRVTKAKKAVMERESSAQAEDGDKDASEVEEASTVVEEHGLVDE